MPAKVILMNSYYYKQYKVQLKENIYNKAMLTFAHKMCFFPLLASYGIIYLLVNLLEWRDIL